jgi:DnaJ-domain-containing protein 1
MKDYYYILGVQENASLSEIKSAFRKLSKKLHPDVNSNDRFFTDKFREVLEAYEVLSNESARQNYDASFSSFHDAKNEAFLYEQIKRERENINREKEKLRQEREQFNNSKAAPRPPVVSTTPKSQESSTATVWVLIIIAFCVFIFFIANSGQKPVSESHVAAVPEAVMPIAPSNESLLLEEIPKPNTGKWLKGRWKGSARGCYAPVSEISGYGNDPPRLSQRRHRRRMGLIVAVFTAGARRRRPASIPTTRAV